MRQNTAQVILRPNDRLSDMQAIMEQTQAFENRVLERLNAGKTVRSFLITAVELLTEAVNILVLQVFRKDDYAVKYAVEPLLDGDGPLGDLSVRLKLIYGLGVLSRPEYEDAELLMALREELNHDGNEYGNKIHIPLKKHNIFRIIKDTSGIYFWQVLELEAYYKC